MLFALCVSKKLKFKINSKSERRACEALIFDGWSLDVTSENHWLLHTAFFFLSVAPSKPIIIAPPGDPQPSKNGQLVIYRPGLSSEGSGNDPSLMDDKLRLICQSKGGLPPPSFEWFHRGLPVRPSYLKSSGSTHTDAFSSSGSRAANEGQAFLEIPKSDLMNGDRLTCVVSNKATQRATNLGQQKLLAEVIVTVQSKLVDFLQISLNIMTRYVGYPAELIPFRIFCQQKILEQPLN